MDIVKTSPAIILCAGSITVLTACGSGSNTIEFSAVATTSTSSLGSSDIGSSTPPDLATSIVSTDLHAPWSIAFHEDTPLVSERDTAHILEISDNGSTRTIREITQADPGGEGGLLGIAVRDAALYAYVTAQDDNRVITMPLSGEPGALSLGQVEVILEGIPKATTHNGGRIAFGPDGMLYITTGDAGQPDHAQDQESLVGKILRVNPGDGSAPVNNPFPGSAVYSMGHRNPQGIAWDAEGVLYSSEFGQSTWDELNIITPGGNYGWPVVEGIAQQGGFIDPIQQWRPVEASPSGMTIIGGSIFIANLRGQTLREVPLADQGASQIYLNGEFGRFRDAAVSPVSGDLLVLTNNTDGRGSPTGDDDLLLRVDLER